MADTDEANLGIDFAEFSVEMPFGNVPVALWKPLKAAGRRPVILVGHGGSQHKSAAPVQEIASVFVRQHGFIVVAIDGPIHGARREELVIGPERQREFLSMWMRDTRIPQMVADWCAVIDVISGREDVDANSIAWCGVSMGTAYGLPLLAADKRIRAAVIGMWGADYPNSAELAKLAPNVGCPILFQQKWNDQIFSRQGQLELFDLLGSKSKWLKVYMGPHGPLVTEQIEDLERFLVYQLGSKVEIGKP